MTQRLKLEDRSGACVAGPHQRRRSHSADVLKVEPIRTLKPDLRRARRRTAAWIQRYEAAPPAARVAVCAPGRRLSV